MSCSSSATADMIYVHINVADPQSASLKIYAVQGRGRVQIVPSTSQRLIYGREELRRREGVEGEWPWEHHSEFKDPSVWYHRSIIVGLTPPQR
jgi:hypothetical protein